MPVCPAGGEGASFGSSYKINAVSTAPERQIAPGIHELRSQDAKGKRGKWESEKVGEWERTAEKGKGGRKVDFTRSANA